MKGDIRIQRCKGARDLSPEEMIRFRLIEETFRSCCIKAGYEEVRTPTLEYLYLFTSAGTLTPGMLGKVYSFLDWDGWSGERVVLRPDGTIPVARFYIERMRAKQLAKLFYITNIFIFEETGKEKREKWQGGVELIGASSPLADVELMVLALEVLKKLGLEGIELRLSHAGLIRAILGNVDIDAKEQADIFDRVLDGDTGALSGIKEKKPELERALSLLLDMKGDSSGFLRNLKALFNRNLPEFEHCIDDFISIVDLLQALDYRYQIDVASGRGFEYYTGVIFQLFSNGEKLGGGGRYDDLIPLLGQGDIPASGFALYFDSLMSLVKPETLAKPPMQKILVRAKPGDIEATKRAFVIADGLREVGYMAEVGLGGEETDSLRWMLDVRSELPLFTLTDRVNNRKYEAQNTTEVLALLGEEGANKDSTA